MPDPATILAKRRVLTDAMHAMHPDQRILIDQTRAEALERAWNEYDEAIRKDENQMIRAAVLT